VYKLLIALLTVDNAILFSRYKRKPLRRVKRRIFSFIFFNFFFLTITKQTHFRHNNIILSTYTRVELRNIWIYFIFFFLNVFKIGLGNNRLLSPFQRFFHVDHYYTMLENRLRCEPTVHSSQTDTGKKPTRNFLFDAQKNNIVDDLPNQLKV
jgi:hypothetical protein